MDDRTVLRHIEELIAREHALEAEHSGTAATDEQRHQLHEVEVELDQCWDLLRQRRARRTAGLDPDSAQIRAEGVVENYLQ